MSNFTKSAIGLMGVTIISKILGFGREMTLASAYGTSMYTDAFLVAANIPMVVFATIGAALSTTFIPLYFENEKLGGEQQANKYTNNIISIFVILSMIITIIGIIFAEPIVRVFAIGFKGETLRITVMYTRIMMLGMMFIGLSNIMSALLQIKNNFIIPGLIGIPYNIIIIVSIILSISIDKHIILAIGMLLAIFSQALFQIPFVLKGGYRYKIYINIRDKYIKKMISLVGPVIIGVAVNQINIVIDKGIASTLQEGCISALNYANRLNGFVLGLFIASIVSIIYPIFSKLSQDSNKEKFYEIIIMSIKSVIILIIPITIGAIVLSEPIVKLLFERGAFDIEATEMTSKALIFYSIGMIGFALRDILGKIFYSIQDTKTPMINGSITVGLNIVLNFIFVKFIGYTGLALATSVSSIICIILLFISLNKKLNKLKYSNVINILIKSIIASTVMGIIIYLLYVYLNNILYAVIFKDLVILILTIIIGIIIYAIIMYMLKVNEISLVINAIKSKVKSK